MKKITMYLVLVGLFWVWGCEHLDNVNQAYLRQMNAYSEAEGCTLRDYNQRQRDRHYGGNFTDEELRQQQLDRMERQLNTIENSNKTLYGKPLYKKW